MRVKYVCCVRARDVRMIPKIIDNQPMWRMSECRVRFGHCGRSFISPAIYRSASAKIIVISGSMFWASSHFRSVSTDAVHMPLLPSWIYLYMCCIVSRVTPQCGQRLVVACPCRCRIFMVGRVLLMHFVMTCDCWNPITWTMWTMKVS